MKVGHNTSRNTTSPLKAISSTCALGYIRLRYYMLLQLLRPSQIFCGARPWRHKPYHFFPFPLHQHFYVSTSCQLRRAEAASRSPIYSHISETFQGSSVIRAHKDQQRFISKSNFLVDENQRICFPGAVADRYKAAQQLHKCSAIMCWEKRRGHPATAPCSPPPAGGLLQTWSSWAMASCCLQPCLQP